MTVEGQRWGQIHFHVSLPESSSLNLWTKSLNLKMLPNAYRLQHDIVKIIKFRTSG